VPGAGCTESAGSAERVLHELDVADLVVRHLGQHREGRSNFLAERARFVGKASEHRDTLFIGDDVFDLERLCLLNPADTVEDVDDGLWPAVCTRPRKYLVQFGIVEVQRNIGYVLGGEAANMFKVRRVR